MFRKFFNKYKGWIYYHRILTVCFITALVIHILDVGIQGLKLFLEAQESYTATFTSTGIINAVNDALSKAIISRKLPDQLQQPENRRKHKS